MDRHPFPALGHIAYTSEQIQARVAELAVSVYEDLQERKIERPLFVSVLKGSVVFMADLLRRIPLEMDIDFISISRYSGDAGSGVVRIVKDLEEPLEGRDVVVVEDIVDTGLSLSYLLRTLETRSPASVTVCTLIDKQVLRIADLPVDYVGFETPHFLVGYGLDLHGRYRNLSYLVAVTDVRALGADPDALVPSLFPHWRKEALC